jgi:uncharacterized protein (TIGR02145 family)
MKKKNRNWLCPLIVMGIVLILTHSCKKDEEPTDIITDKDGNVYTSVTIGAQVWMVENLAYLPSVSPSAEESETDPYYYVYDYEGSSVSEAKATNNYKTYGVLYNWPAAMVSCPDGWHLPSDAEWTQLTDYLGVVSVAGGKLKETGTTHWDSPNTGATNETGFTALPGGGRDIDGTFGFVGELGIWWSVTAYNTYDAWGRFIGYSHSYLDRNHMGKELGVSVRCLRD